MNWLPVGGSKAKGSKGTPKNEIRQVLGLLTTTEHEYVLRKLDEWGFVSVAPDDGSGKIRCRLTGRAPDTADFYRFGKLFEEVAICATCYIYPDNLNSLPNKRPTVRSGVECPTSYAAVYAVLVNYQFSGFWEHIESLINNNIHYSTPVEIGHYLKKYRSMFAGNGYDEART